jgi:hypothetical protein
MKKKEGNEKEKTREPSLTFSSFLVQGVRHPKLLHF